MFYLQERKLRHELIEEEKEQEIGRIICCPVMVYVIIADRLTVHVAIAD